MKKITREEIQNTISKEFLTDGIYDAEPKFVGEDDVEQFIDTHTIELYQDLPADEIMAQIWSMEDGIISLLESKGIEVN